MKMTLFIPCVLILVASAVYGIQASPDNTEMSTANEREWIISMAIKETQATLQQVVPIVNMTSFKRGSMEAKANGRGYNMYRDMIARAETMLTEAGLVEDGDKSSQYSHGSLLTLQELAKMWTICCEEITVVPRSRCKSVSREFRTVDGICNNLRNPTFGAHATIFPRFLPPLYENRVDSPRGRRQSQFGKSFLPPNPSARHVSLSIHPDRPINERSFTNLIWQWGQFTDHDITLSPETEVECKDCEFTGSCEPIRVAKKDPAFGLGTQNKGNCMRFRRSIPACPIKKSPVREQINDLTSFIDGSMIYGSTERVSRALRQFRGGLMKVGPNFPGRQPSLPRITRETKNLVICMGRMDCFLAGDIRANEQTGLLIMHTIWVREHNRCARNIARINRMSNDEQIYQLCRKIVGAIIQKITYQDWLPKLFGQKGFAKYIGRYRGYRSRVNPGVPNAFATASFRFGHSMVQPLFGRLDRNFKPLPIGPLLLRNAFFNPPQYRKSLGTDPILRAMLTGQSRSLDRFIEKTLTTLLFQTKTNPGFDLVALNIQRGRDHGLQPFLQYAKFCFRKFRAKPLVKRVNLDRLLRVYGSLKTVDLFVGGLNELRLPGSIFGPTFACLNGLGFRAIRDGDRFYYEKKGVFTRRQLSSIQRHTLSRVLCDNMDDLGKVQRDAFLVSRKRVSCKSIPRFNYKPFRMDKLAEKEDIVESNYENVESENDEMESDENLDVGAEWNTEDIIENEESLDVNEQDIEDYSSDEYVDIMKMDGLEGKDPNAQYVYELEKLVEQKEPMNTDDEDEVQSYGCTGKGSDES